jgi:hypothetical protein
MIFIAALAVDTLSTIHFMIQAGPEQEFHPIVRIAAYTYGPILGPILAAGYKALAAMIVVLYWKKAAIPLFTTAAAFYLLAGLYNYFAVEWYVQGLTSWLPF